MKIKWSLPLSVKERSQVWKEEFRKYLGPVISLLFPILLCRRVIYGEEAGRPKRPDTQEYVTSFRE